MELSPFIVLAFFGIVAIVDKAKEKRENHTQDSRRKEYTPEQRREYIRVYNEFFM